MKVSTQVSCEPATTTALLRKLVKLGVIHLDSDTMLQVDEKTNDTIQTHHCLGSSIGYVRGVSHLES